MQHRHFDIDLDKDVMTYNSRIFFGGPLEDLSMQQTEWSLIRGATLTLISTTDFKKIKIKTVLLLVIVQAHDRQKWWQPRIYNDPATTLLSIECSQRT